MVGDESGVARVALVCGLCHLSTQSHVCVNVSTYHVACLLSDSRLIGHLFKNEPRNVAAQSATTRHTPQCPFSTWPSFLFKTRYMWEPHSVSLQSDSSASLNNHRLKTLHFIAVKRKSVEMNIKCVLRSRLALRFHGVSRARHDVPRA